MTGNEDNYSLNIQVSMTGNEDNYSLNIQVSMTGNEDNYSLNIQVSKTGNEDNYSLNIQVSSVTLPLPPLYGPRKIPEDFGWTIASRSWSHILEILERNGRDLS